MKDEKLYFEIVTPERTVLQEPDIDFIVARKTDRENDTESELGIFPFHAPMLALVPMGVIRYKKLEEVFFIITAGGFLEVKENRVSLVSLAAEKAKEGDVGLEKIKIAKEKAEKWLEEIAGKAVFDEKAAETEVRKAMVSFYKGSSNE
jgi:F-type H+-transporting ATPase subunit epsilon